MPFKFEKLPVWQKALELTSLVHDISARFPNAEKYILTKQIKKAADSVAVNIAEGTAGQTNAEFNRSLGLSWNSGFRVIGYIFIAQKRKIINEEDFNKIYKLSEEILLIITSLRKTLVK